MAASHSGDDDDSSFLSLKLFNRTNLHIRDVGFVKEGSYLLNLKQHAGHARKCVKMCENVCTGEQGWPSGESARLPPICPGFDSRTRRHKWAEFCWFSTLLREVFPRVLRFSPLLKNQHLI